MPLLLILSFTGYILLLNQKAKIRLEYCPVIICASISSLMVIGGVIVSLAVSAYALLFLGIAAFIYTLTGYKSIKFSVRDYYLVVAFLALLVYFAVILGNQHFTHYDNFSHWATVAKSMLLTDRMPNETDALVTFQSYPLGSSVFVYYICRFTGAKEGLMMLAQLIVMLSSVFALVAGINRKNLILLPVIVLWAVSSLTVYSNIFMLLVDTVMPLSGIAILSMFIYGRDNSNQKDIRKLILSVMPVAFFLIQVKNSGIYYLAVALVYFAVSLWRVSDLKNRILFVICDIAVPLSSMALWKIHLLNAFTNANSTEHSVSVSYYADISRAKSASDVKTIISTLLDKLPYSTATFMLFIAGLIYVSVILANKKNGKSCSLAVKELAGMVIAYVLYIVSLGAMYIFSMPLEEALELASFDRYTLSAYIFLMGMTVIFVIKNYENGISTIMGVVTIAITALIVCVYYERLPVIWGVNKAEYTCREELLSAIEGADISNNSKCLVYYGYTNERYLLAVARYDLWTNDVTICNSDNLYQCTAIINNYDYFIIITPDSIVNEFVEANFGDIYGSDNVNVINIPKNSEE